MNALLSLFTLALLVSLSAGCSAPATPAGIDDAGIRDAGIPDSGVRDAELRDLTESPACTVGARAPSGDGCNWCECHAGGVSECTHRTCPLPDGCTYAGTLHEYGTHFPSTNGCNECVCAASGIACTRRACPNGVVVEEGAILLGGLMEPCGGLPDLTGAEVLSYVRPAGYHAPFLYQRSAMYFPETLPDTISHVRIAYRGGFVVCRIPSPGQEAIDMEVEVEVLTEDGAFNEGFHTYLRRTRSRFVDNASTLSSITSPAALNGTYTPGCRDPRALSFSAEFYPGGAAIGNISKTCEIDIGATVGLW